MRMFIEGKAFFLTVKYLEPRTVPGTEQVFYK